MEHSCARWAQTALSCTRLMADRTGRRKHAQHHLTYSPFFALVRSSGPWATVALSCTPPMVAGPGSGKERRAYLLANPALAPVALSSAKGTRSRSLATG